MKQHKNHIVFRAFLKVTCRFRLLTAGILITVAGSVVSVLLPPLMLEKIVNTLTEMGEVSLLSALFYFGLTGISCLFQAAREVLLTMFGQKITRQLRSEMCGKLSKLPAAFFAEQDAGTTVSRFVNDVDTVEALFSSGIISMFIDVCKIISIFAIIFVKSKGLGVLLVLIIPVLFAFTRMVQKKMLRAQLDNREAIGRVNNHVPETIRNIRMIHTFRKEKYMQDKYDKAIEDSYRAVEKTNFYDAVYSPVILVINALVVAVMMVLSAYGDGNVREFFGMSVGTVVAVIAYVGQIFGPLESIGMEIQTIQSAVAGVKRIDEFLGFPERWQAGSCENADEKRKEMTGEKADGRSKSCVELSHVSFGYEPSKKVLEDVSFSVKTGEHVTLTGRTGAGKSTIFKLLLGFYRPDEGEILINGREAAEICDSEKRHLFGYVEQKFVMVPGTVLEQITLFDEEITREKAEAAARIAGIHEAVMQLGEGYDTVCTEQIFSQGQWQLLSIARAVAANPPILLLDEITANLDSETEQTVLNALEAASKNRTVISISHRLYEKNGGREIVI